MKIGYVKIAKHLLHEDAFAGLFFSTIDVIKAKETPYDKLLILGTSRLFEDVRSQDTPPKYVLMVTNDANGVRILKARKLS